MGDVQKVVAEIADELVASGAERGLQVAAYVGGEPVVDLAAGVADPATGRPVEPGTLFYNWSIGKGATATLVHRLWSTPGRSTSTRGSRAVLSSLPCRAGQHVARRDGALAESAVASQGPWTLRRACAVCEVALVGRRDRHEPHRIELSRLLVRGWC